MQPSDAIARLRAMLKAPLDSHSVWFEGGEIKVSIDPAIITEHGPFVPVEVHGYRVRQVGFPPPVPDRTTQQIATGTDYLRSARIVQAALIEGEQVQAELRRLGVSRFGSLADRIKTKQESREAWAEGVHKRLDAIDAKEPGILAATEKHVTESIEAEIDAMEAELRKLGNLPLGTSDA
jgi:hypothetical protein